MKNVEISLEIVKLKKLPEILRETRDFLPTWRESSVLCGILYRLFDPEGGSEESSILGGAADVKDKRGSLYRMWSMYPGVSDGGFIAGSRHGED